MKSENFEGSNHLILTDFQFNYDINSDYLFAGPWCLADKEDKPDNSSYHSYHWDDRDKLEKDYFYLGSLHGRLLNALVSKLNEIHNTSFDLRYWQIILDPWLSYFICAAFDRFETLRTILPKGHLFPITFFNINEIESIPFDTTQFVNFSNSEVWNQYIFQKIILDCFKSDFNLSVNDKFISQDMGEESKPNYNGLIRRVIFTFCKSPKNIFLSGGISPEIVKAIEKESKTDRYFLYATNLLVKESDYSKRKLFELRNEKLENFEPVNKFEEFIHSNILFNMPKCALEYYSQIKQESRAIRRTPKVIVSGGEHFYNTLIKTWIAEQVTKNSKLIISEHGGSLQVFRDLFDFEVNICDAKAIWNIPFHKKHHQLPPLKYSYSAIPKDQLTIRRGDQILIIAADYPKYVLRAQFYPISHQILSTFTFVTEFYDNLEGLPQENVLIKPYPIDCGWNLKNRYLNYFGEDKVSKEVNLFKNLLSSRLVICTYPETTFSDALITDTPAILLYSDKYNKMHPISDELISALREAKMLFYSPMEASKHVNKIYERTDIWWASPEVTRAKALFFKQAIRLSDDWVIEWKDFLTRVSNS
jgi:putative transferase (TIGR04331 family)